MRDTFHERNSIFIVKLDDDEYINRWERSPDSINGTTIILQSDQREEKEKNLTGEKKGCLNKRLGTVYWRPPHRISNNETSVQYRTSAYRHTKLSRRKVSKRIRISHYSLYRIAQFLILKYILQLSLISRQNFIHIFPFNNILKHSCNLVLI